MIVSRNGGPRRRKKSSGKEAVRYTRKRSQIASRLYPRFIAPGIGAKLADRAGVSRSAKVSVPEGYELFQMSGQGVGRGFAEYER